MVDQSTDLGLYIFRSWNLGLCLRSYILNFKKSANCVVDLVYNDDKSLSWTLGKYII